MKSVCSVHEQAYDVGSRCPYCEVPEATDRDWATGSTGAIMDAWRSYANCTSTTSAFRISVAEEMKMRQRISAAEYAEIIGGE